MPFPVPRSRLDDLMDERDAVLEQLDGCRDDACPHHADLLVQLDDLEFWIDDCPIPRCAS